MKLSHSKLGTILHCPMSYYLSYHLGIRKKEEKTAFAIGSAVHWGIERSEEDLTNYFAEHGGFGKRESYGRDQLLSEAMVHGYLKHEDDILKQLLTDPATGKQLEILEKTHELWVEAKLKSRLSHVEYHNFVGIVDLLILTDKGFVIVDYKTSSMQPDWDSYLEQLYRYMFLIQDMFPEIPIIKLAIINIRKTGIRQKKTENTEQFFNRLKFEYDLNDENYVNYHEYLPSEFNASLMSLYFENLTDMSDFAQTICDTENFYINFPGAKGQYGKGDYWDIFYQTPGAEVLYKINDETLAFDDFGNAYIAKSRDCVAIDMHVINRSANLMNSYKRFKSVLLQEVAYSGTVDTSNDVDIEKLKTTVFNVIKENMIFDDELLDLYFETYLFEKK